MYGISDSSHRIGTWVITSIGDIFPAITHNLHSSKGKIDIFQLKATPDYKSVRTLWYRTYHSTDKPYYKDAFRYPDCI